MCVLEEKVLKFNELSIIIGIQKIIYKIEVGNLVLYYID